MVRRSTIAGTWYPGSRDQLKRTIESYYAETQSATIKGELLGLISPHAGYMYSGKVAAAGYRLIQGKKYDVIVILAPMHQMAIAKYAINREDEYETPLGRIPIHSELRQELKHRLPIEEISGDTEHAIEIQLPFVQTSAIDPVILPVLIGTGDVFSMNDLSDTLFELLKDRTVLLIASTDLHHMNDYESLRELDRQVVDVLTTMELNQIQNRLNQRNCSVCGRAAVAAMIEVSKKMGARSLQILMQTNSGDVTGMKEKSDYTVGYLSAAVVR